MVQSGPWALTLQEKSIQVIQSLEAMPSEHTLAMQKDIAYMKPP